MNIEQQSTMQENTPRPFKEIPGLWLQLRNMTETFFASELPRASQGNTLYSVLISAGIASFFWFIQAIAEYFIPAITNQNIPDQSQLAAIFGSILAYPCFALIITPISFYLSNGLIFVSAKILGGKGKFSGQVYLYSLFFVPLGLILSLASLFQIIPIIRPVIDYIVTAAVFIFTILFTVRIIKVAHGFTTGRALSTFLIPFALFLIPTCVIGILVLLGPAVGGVFSNIVTEINTPMP